MKIAARLDRLQATEALAGCLAEVLRPGDVILMTGDLGAGKTTLTRMVAARLGIDEREVTSPSFALVHEYRGGKIPLIHADLYRLGPHPDLSETGLEEALDGQSLLIVEWAEHLDTPLSESPLRLFLGWLSENEREVRIEAEGRAWETRLVPFKECLLKADLMGTG